MLCEPLLHWYESFLAEVEEAGASCSLCGACGMWHVAGCMCGVRGQGAGAGSSLLPCGTPDLVAPTLLSFVIVVCGFHMKCGRLSPGW